MARISTRSAQASTADEDRVSILRAHAEHLPSPETIEFADAFGRFGGAKLVLLGEATHGTSEFYRARAAISRELIEHHDFNIVTAEADWPDAALVDRFVRHIDPEPPQAEIFSRFPTWMWRNEEFRDFVLWLRAYNERLPKGSRVEFRGLDVYSLNASIQAVLRYLDRVDKEAAERARRRYGCLTPWQNDPSEYGAAALAGEADCEEAVTAELQDLLGKRLDYERSGGEAFFDAAQNARIARAAEEYYRLMYYGSVESWNLRDRHMFDTLQRVIQRRGPGARAIVWAHNSHVGNAAATAMGWHGEFNIGELARIAYGDDCVAIGFGTDKGRVAAADAWDHPMRVMTVIPARTDSYEALFRETRVPLSLTDWSRAQSEDVRQVLSEPRLERAIGVIYRPQSELASHYFKAVLSDQFDAYVWFAETDAIAPLGPLVSLGVPETYPIGL